MKSIKSLLLISVFYFYHIGCASAGQNDVLFLYTDPANAYEKGNIAARAAQFIAVTNQIYRDSGVNMTVRSVGVQHYSSSNMMPNDSDLSHITRDTSLLSKRNALRPDFVVLLGKMASDACGIGWVGNMRKSIGAVRSYSIVAVDCPDYVLAHELGHNMGLNHSERQVKSSFDKPGIVPYGYGYGVDGVFVTVMAYQNAFGNAPKLYKFSDPTKTYNGIAIGSQNANATAALNFVEKDMANFSDCTFFKSSLLMGGFLNNTAGYPSLPMCL